MTIKVFLKLYIPDVDAHVAIQLKRAKFVTDKVLLDVPDDENEDLDTHNSLWEPKLHRIKPDLTVHMFDDALLDQARRDDASTNVAVNPMHDRAKEPPPVTQTSTRLAAWLHGHA